MPDSTRTIPVTRAITLFAYMGALRNIGAPVDAGLRRARLPTLIEQGSHCWVPYRLLRLFIADMAYREGIPDLGSLGQSNSIETSLEP